ncbi:1-phosphofructokinase family hexose kinase [Salibaculum griseiflavum]|uniref:Phosphofructokinase n=1 Tax=Salibaculum griseiflavum TaxID=1914409 RepID=A0A2V1P556_9RHOB|nr:1-phosphofructokinase family hexose kinase [Salibaculum griseiflavum]PWG17565.1 carbohydrate kinase [Salibaculum griseiflavum]
MHEILTVTLNPAFDLATSVAKIVPDAKLRCAPPEQDPGGGGLNVSRAIHQLGGTSKAFVALGGDTGSALEHLLRRTGLQIIVHEAPGETRQSLAVTDLSTNEQFRFMLPGPDWSREDILRARAAICECAQQDGFIVLSGSGPHGAAPDLYARICEDVSDSGAEVILDTSGPALAHLAAGQDNPPYLLRMDSHEAETLARRPLNNRGDSAAFAERLVKQGAARMVIVARGADGSVLADGTRKLRVNAADVTVRSRVGAGDSFVAGFVMALAQDHPIEEAFRRGSAAASAACMTEGTQLCLPQDFEALLEKTEVETL